MPGVEAKLFRRFLILAVIALCATLPFAGALRSQTQESGNKTAKVDNKVHGKPHDTLYWTLKTDAKGDLVLDSSKLPVWILAKAPDQSKPPRSRIFIGYEAEVTVNCRTEATDQAGRKSCNDDEVHTLPPGWVFAQNEATTTWTSRIGSENDCDISWDDFVEVIPGSGYNLPRTMRVHGHARSGHDYGERGHTVATVKCRFFSYGGR